MAQKNLSIKLSLNDRQFQSGLKKATRSMKKFGSSMKRTGQTLSRNLTLPLVAFGAASIAAFDKQQKAIAQVEAGIKSTGMAAGFTSKQLQKMASELQGKTLFGDEVILKDATAQLLTFTNIAGEQFARTQVAALNLATRLDGDLKSASIQLGKALNDPIANLSALSRSGIQFSEEQKKVIKELAETNRLAEAQTLILDELEKQYGGAAEAAAQAGAGGLKQLQNQFGDLMEEIGGMLIPIVIDLGNQFKSFLEGFAKLDPEVKKLIITVGILAGALGPLLVLLGSLVTIIAGLSIKLIAITAALTAVGLLIIYIVDNIEQLKDTEYSLSFFFNSFIMGLQETLRALGLFVEGYNAFLDLIGLGDVEFLKASNEFAKLADNLDPALLETGQYESKFESFTDFLDRQGVRLKKIMGDIADSLNLGGGGAGDGSTSTNLPQITPKRNQPGMMAGAMTQAIIPDDLIKQMELFEQQQSNIFTLTEELDQSFMSFGNVLQGTFAQALQSSDGFFKSFVEGSKRAMSALMAQLAATLALNALLGGSKLGGMLGLKDIGGLGGIGTALKGLFMADGGLATGATLAMVGEGPGTSLANPEVIAPLDKLKSMIGINGGGAVEVFGTISGQDILLSSDRARNNRTRTRGY